MKQIKLMLRYLLLILLPLGGMSMAHASWEESRDAVDSAMGEMLALLERSDLSAEGGEAQLLQDVQSVLDSVVNFDYVAKRVMGKYYRRASADHRQAFTAAFRDTLIRTYAKSLAEFDIDRFEMAPQGKASPKPHKQIVSVYVYSGTGQRYTLVYYMLKKENGWQAVNVLVDGINLRLNFKNQFADMVSQAKGNVGKAVTNWQSLVEIDSKEG